MGRAARKRAASTGYTPHSSKHHMVMQGFKTLTRRREQMGLMCLDCYTRHGYRKMSQVTQLPRGGYKSERAQRQRTRVYDSSIPLRPDVTLIVPVEG